jgi:hypothetical protein
MSGKMISDAAVDLAHSRGYIVAHFSPARVRDSFITNYAYDSKGYPDLTLVGPKMIVIEVKGDGDKLSPEQERWLEAFEKAGIQTMVLTSKAWREGELERIL